MKRRKLGVLRNRIGILLKNDIKKFEQEYSVEFTAAAKKNLLSSTVRVFHEKSRDLKKGGTVIIEKGHRLKFQARPVRDVILEDNINVVEVTRNSIQKVIGEAKSIAIELGCGNKITTNHIEKAIENRWCKIYPVCNKITGRKLGLKVSEEIENDK